MAALILVDLQADFLEDKQDRPSLVDSHPYVRLLPALLRSFSTR